MKSLKVTNKGSYEEVLFEVMIGSKFEEIPLCVRGEYTWIRNEDAECLLNLLTQRLTEEYLTFNKQKRIEQLEAELKALKESHERV